MKLNDIARLAGVSRSTVSRVVNNDPRVSEEVRSRVQETIARVGYQPNAAARALASRKTGIIGLVIPEDFATVYADPWFPPLIQACLDAAKGTNQSVMLLMEPIDDSQAVDRLIHRFVRPGTVDGLILSNSMVNDMLTPQLQEMNFPYIVIGRSYVAGRNFVDVPNRMAAVEITRHLLSHGRTRPAMINGPESVMSAVDRREGFIEAIREAGHDPADVPIVNVEFSRPGAYTAALEMLSGDDRPDCVFAASDTIAVSVIEAAHRLNIHVPDQLGVAGFDDILPERNARRGLTTVRQPVMDMAAEAVAQLNDLIRRRIEPPVEIWLEITLSLRHSCGCDISASLSDGQVPGKESVIAV
jgi:LacI family transcriptional regulator